jgi:leucyl-tRNA synthetase
MKFPRYPEGRGPIAGSWVNGDPIEQTVLANELVIDGQGRRSGAPVEKAPVSQWFLKITATPTTFSKPGHAERWPEAVR